MLWHAYIGIGVTVTSQHSANTVMSPQEWGILSYYHSEADNIERYSHAIHMYIQSQLSIHNSMINSLLSA